jgi:hypothetical protein
VTAAAIILAAALAVAAVLWVARPFLLRTEVADDERAPEDRDEQERTRLLEERDRALAALKELEFDNRTGKVSDADYRELAGPLRREAAAAIAALDALAGDADPSERMDRAPGAAGPPVPEREREEQPR